MSFHVPEYLRDKAFSSMSDGNNGLFFYHTSSGRDSLKIIASDGAGWDHVSVSKKYECPSWKDMCLVKDLFWDPEDCVIQFHPPKSLYVNNHPFCLHLWFPQNEIVKLPPTWMVGVK